MTIKITNIDKTIDIYKDCENYVNNAKVSFITFSGDREITDIETGKKEWKYDPIISIFKSDIISVEIS